MQALAAGAKRPHLSTAEMEKGRSKPEHDKENESNNNAKKKRRLTRMR